ncbi:hypothetical protein [Streptomyces sp. NPDC020597]|uniref:hypothetical protein n=1 Tax=unclassified Streptomyces TaxID=2593676 RepID=UPI0037A4FCE0
MTTTRVDVRIRRLVLDSPHEVSRAALCAAVEAELSAMLSRSPDGGREHGSGPRRGGAPRPSGVADAHLALLARAVARAVHRAMAAGEQAGPDRPGPQAGAS